MSLVLISPEYDDPRELTLLGELFAAGLERYHVRKPHASAAELEAWLRQMPVSWRPNLVLHQHHELVDALSLGGRHWRDQAVTADAGSALSPSSPSAAVVGRGVPAELLSSNSMARREVEPSPKASAGITSRSCHDIATLRACLGHFDSVFFGPIFPSISKLGYAPAQSDIGEAVGAVLHMRTPAERRTAVIAIGGMTAETAPRALALGFDGVAVLGAVWQAADPVDAFRRIQVSVGRGLRSAPSQRDHVQGFSLSTF